MNFFTELQILLIPSRKLVYLSDKLRIPDHAVTLADLRVNKNVRGYRHFVDLTDLITYFRVKL
jgi:hypothetical protein